MSGRFLLDTNIIIGLFQEDPAVKKNLEIVSEVYVPVIALGELYYGALKSERWDFNLKIIRDFSSNFM